ncbi:iron export ABC transporter permease subunit FetB [Bifidobacterium sp. ESL0745]|uniref:ABC transporter permease n=1 Tax=Bifidobacterium sp. ESL0745 TaxID=2983226 RepID=UPI0023F6E941|nr:iron export ABC transporter permease subunit FetB [Bifidobacterium sp. ESL0745]MDF7665565.1 iron export ABC transporter permease subunit FetB [Bifidobacterium sp. ESL0745]
MMIPTFPTASITSGTITTAVTAHQGVYTIDALGLTVTLVLVAVSALVAYLLKLDVGGKLIWAAIRSFVQLMVMGFIITYIITANNPWFVIAVIAVMILAAVEITLTRTSNIPHGLALPVLLTLAVTATFMVSVATELIIKPDTWYSPQVLVPMAGMLLGNLVSAVAVAMSRFFSDMENRRYEVEAYLSLGATPFEAARPSIMEAIRLGLVPTISSLASSGIVLIPGMMSGQIMAGGNPLEAAKYQFVILAIISALTLLGDTMIMLLIYHRCFTKDGQYFQPKPRGESHLFEWLKVHVHHHENKVNAK